MPPADVALAADLAGLEAGEWLARAVAEPYAGTPKGDALQRALKKWLVATGVAIATGGAQAVDFIRCAACLPEWVVGSRSS